jgi:hypothetical protein
MSGWIWILARSVTGWLKAGFVRAPELDRVMSDGSDHVLAQFYKFSRDQ